MIRTLSCILTQNDINDIPFFDVELPYELALKIFQFLDRRDLGRCAQVEMEKEYFIHVCRLVAILF